MFCGNPGIRRRLRRGQPRLRADMRPDKLDIVCVCASAHQQQDRVSGHHIGAKSLWRQPWCVVHPFGFAAGRLSDKRSVQDQWGAHASSQARGSAHQKARHKIQWIRRNQNMAGRMLKTHVFRKRPASRTDGHKTARQTTRL